MLIITIAPIGIGLSIAPRIVPANIINRFQDWVVKPSGAGIVKNIAPRKKMNASLRVSVLKWSMVHIPKKLKFNFLH
jgi:hypothetical protein